MALKFIEEADFTNKRVLARFDFNVPIDKETKTIKDTSRIDLALPTIKHVLENGAKKLIMMSHLGRPKGQPNKDFSLEPVATYIADKIGADVILADSAVDGGVKSFINLPDTKIILLENLRFNAEEKSNDHDFARKLSEYGDIYINDAFGVNHRKHASVHEIIKFFPRASYGGFLIRKEVESLDKILNKPAKPFVSIIGGAKVSDKIQTIEKLVKEVDQLIIGGAMAFPFLKAKGHTVGKSLCSDDDVELAKKIIKLDKGGKIKLPLDHIVSDSIDGKPETVNEINISDDKMGLDIGPLTISAYESILSSAKTVLWNGPLGLFENPDFSEGTNSIARLIASSDAYSVVGGGDSVSAVKKSGLTEQFSHISTGGGASLEYIEKGELPGIQALKFGL